MTTTTTIKFVVHGDSYEELKTKADIAISKFLGVSDNNDDEGEELDLDEEDYEPEHLNQKIDYELLVTENEDISSDHQYTAEVIAKVKDVKR